MIQQQLSDRQQSTQDTDAQTAGHCLMQGADSMAAGIEASCSALVLALLMSRCCHLRPSCCLRPQHTPLRAGEARGWHEQSTHICRAVQLRCPRMPRNAGQLSCAEPWLAATATSAFACPNRAAGLPRPPPGCSSHALQCRQALQAAPRSCSGAVPRPHAGPARMAQHHSSPPPIAPPQLVGRPPHLLAWLTCSTRGAETGSQGMPVGCSAAACCVLRAPAEACSAIEVQQGSSASAACVH